MDHGFVHIYYPGGLSATSVGWFSGIIPPEHVSALPESLPETDAELALHDAVVATEVDNKVKTKLLTMWNNVKYGLCEQFPSFSDNRVIKTSAKLSHCWRLFNYDHIFGWASKMKTNFSKESPVWLLGSRYQKKPEDPNEETENKALKEDASNLDGGLEGFKRDFESRLWLTYRREFPNLTGSNFTSDCGWGCMLRSGQMMLAQALICHFLGRDWRWRPDQHIGTPDQFKKEESLHRMIIKWFGDQPTPHSPLSIHSLVSLGALTGKRAGDWYGPASVAHLLCQAVKNAAATRSEFDNLAVYVAQDCAVYLDDVKSACETVDGDWRSLVLFVPLRLGADKLNPNYAPCLTSLLELDVCIGVIGGRPRHSLYFIGYQEDKLIHLDPHYCQEAVDVWKHNFSLETFHCASPRKMLLSKMDPSCCVGFYLHDKEKFDEFIKKVEPFLVPLNQKVDYPMFLFCEGSGDDIRRGCEVSEGMLSSSMSTSAHDTLEDEAHYECEEFELI